MSDYAETIEQAVRNLGQKVTVGDVSGATGLPVLRVTRELNVLAQKREAILKVSDTGDVVYEFPLLIIGDWAQLLELMKKSAASLSIALSTLLSWAIGWLYLCTMLLLFLTFGFAFVILFLLGSIIVVGGLISVFGSVNEEETGDFVSKKVASAWMAIYPFIAYFIPVTMLKREPTSETQQNFFSELLEFVSFSKFFNSQSTYRRWQLMGELIKKNHGVLIDEQISPFVELPPTTSKDVLDVLVRFNGIPHATDRGNLVYEFDELQVTSVDSLPSAGEPFLDEPVWKVFGMETLRPVCLCLLSTFLGYETLAFLDHPEVFGTTAYKLLDANLILLQNTFHLFNAKYLLTACAHNMFGASIFFLIVGSLRIICTTLVNQGIRYTNELRLECAHVLGQPDESLRLKLQDGLAFHECRDYGSTDRYLYTTDEDVLEQDFRTKID